MNSFLGTLWTIIGWVNFVQFAMAWWLNGSTTVPEASIPFVTAIACWAYGATYWQRNDVEYLHERLEALENKQ